MLTSRTRNARAVGSTAILLMLVGCASGGAAQARGPAIQSATSAVGPLPADQIPSDMPLPEVNVSKPTPTGSEPDGPRNPGGNSMAQLTALACGDRIEALSGSAGGLVVTGDFPPRVERGGSGTFVGAVTVTAAGDGARITGVTTPEADIYIAKSGVVVATPVAKDMIGEAVAIGADDRAVLSARGSFQPCTEGAVELPADLYELFAVVVITKDDGSSVVATGGPWPVEVS